MSKIIIACDALILNEKEEVLLQFRKNTKVFNGFWNTPGGKVEFGERLEDALKREVLEEHDISIELVRFLQPYEGIFPESHTLVGAYLAKIVKGTPKIMEPEKCSDLQWFPLMSLPQPLTPQAKEYVATYLSSKKPL